MSDFDHVLQQNHHHEMVIMAILNIRMCDRRVSSKKDGERKVGEEKPPLSISLFRSAALNNDDFDDYENDANENDNDDENDKNREFFSGSAETTPINTRAE